MTKIIPTLLVLLFFIPLTSGYAQSISDASLLNCKNIKGLAERLFCYDNLSGSIVEDKPEYCSSSTEAWRTECGGDGNYQQPQAQQALAQTIGVVGQVETTQTNSNLDCADLSIREAQDALAGGAYSLDLDNDGIACEWDDARVNRSYSTSNAPLPPQQLEVSNNESRWRVNSEVDPITDFQNIFAALDAYEGQSSWGDEITLVLRCKSNGPEAYIIWDDYLGSDAYVTHRIDSQAPHESDWGLSTDSDTTFYPYNVGSFMLELSTAQKLVAQVTPYNESPTTAIFDLSGIGEVVQKLRYSCGF